MVFDTSIATLKITHFNTPKEWDAFHYQFRLYLDNVSYRILIMDATALSFFVPEQVVILLDAARLWKQSRGLPIEVKFNHDAQAYLQRMDLFEVCDAYLKPAFHVQDKYDRSAESKKLMEITEISGDLDQNYRSVLKAIERGHRILENAGVVSSSVNDVIELLSEISQNITHSEDRGYVIIQSYNNLGTNNGRKVHIAVSDLGIGIEKSLQKRFNANDINCRSGSDFIDYAMQQGVSSHNSTRGLGLDDVRRKVQKSQGFLLIRSCSSRIQIGKSGVFERADNLPFIPGVQVFLTIFGHLDWH